MFFPFAKGRRPCGLYFQVQVAAEIALRRAKTPHTSANVHHDRDILILIQIIAEDWLVWETVLSKMQRPFAR
jgi:hypothetical protein